LKSNIGHTQAAAGVAGIIKMVMAMRRGLMPKTLHVDEPTPEVDWSAGSVELLTEARAWPAVDRPRRAAVSSFGISGTNAHLILEQADPVEDRPTPSEEMVPWLLSARSATARQAQAAQLREWVDHSDLSVSDIGRALVRRTRFDHRAVVVGEERESLLNGLDAVVDGRETPGVILGEATSSPRVGFLFSGQGSQRVGMGAGLAARFPVFADALDEVCAELDRWLDRPIREVMLGSDSEVLGRTEFAQVGLFAVQVALARLLESFGVVPDVVLGHSVGEFAAVHVAGVLSLPDAARLVAARGRLMGGLPAGGAMVAVAASEEEVRARLVGGAEIAAVNGPESVVVSGVEDAVLMVVEGLRSRRLWVSHAFHSSLMEPMLAEFAEVAGELTFQAPKVAVVSSVTGGVGEVMDAGYWVRQVREPVRFYDALQSVDAGVLFEVGPDATLTAMADADVIPLLRKDRDEASQFLTALGRAFAVGVPVAWPTDGAHVELPTYSFQRKRFWLESPAIEVATTDAAFWTEVETEDLPALADRFGVETEALKEIVPAMGTWRRKAREHAAADALRYRVAWHSIPLPQDQRLTGVWIVAVPGGHRATDVTKELEAHGATVVTLEFGPADRAAYARTLRVALDDAPVGIVSLLGRDDVSHPDYPSTSQGVLATLAIAQALGDLKATARLWCVTSGAVAVDRTERVASPQQASVWGFGLALSLETPDTWGGMIDVSDDAATGDLCAALSTGEDSTAVRPSGIFVKRLMHANRHARATTWRPRGTVLVTGGTGGLGGHVARWLADNGADHIVLASRRGQAGELVAELESRTRVTVAACDVTDAAEVQSLVDSLPDLTTVVHAAGVAQTLGPAMDLTFEEFAKVGQAKILGVRNLDAALGDRPLDAFVIFSSGAAIWGGSGQAAYSSANAFLDAYADQRLARGTVATSIAWSSWRSGVVDEEMDALSRRVGAPAMAPELAIRALQQALDQGDERIVVANIDWPRFVPAYTFARPRPLLDAIPEAGAVLDAQDEPVPEPDLLGSLAGMSEGEQSRALLRTVHAAVADVLGYRDPSEIDPARPFEDLGFDSVAAIDLRTRLTAATGRKLSATLVFDHGNPAALAEYLRTQLCATIDDDAPAALGHLDRLAAAVTRMTPQEIDRTRIAARLQQVLSTLTADARPAAERLGTASADDLFDFIDNELGTA
jgi:acyl transferase domain-containing protein/acyl carrier protein